MTIRHNLNITKYSLFDIKLGCLFLEDIYCVLHSNKFRSICPGGILMTSDNFWSAFCVFHAHFWEKTHSFKICALKKRNDFLQLKRSNFRVEKCNTEEYLSKFLNKMAYKTVTSMMDCVMKRFFM